MKNAPSDSDPEITMRPATSSTSACATSGRNVSSGTYSARWRFAASVRAKTVSAAARTARSDALSCANDLTTWTPVIDSSATGRDVGERLLHVAEHRVRDAAVPVRGERDHRRDRERDERELPAVEEEDGRDDDDRHDVLREEDQAVAEEEAHRLQVDRRPRHELARLAAVVEAERKPQEVRVELVAQVVLDAERLPAGDHPSPVHERAADEPERDDRGDLETSIRVSGSPSSSLMTTPVRTRTRIPATCDAIARSDETTSDARYGRRKAEQAHERAPARSVAGPGARLSDTAS